MIAFLIREMGTETLLNFQKVTQLVSGRARFQTQAVWLQGLKSFSHP